MNSFQLSALSYQLFYFAIDFFTLWLAASLGWFLHGWITGHRL